jgi:hypothetical protein
VISTVSGLFGRTRREKVLLDARLHSQVPSSHLTHTGGARYGRLPVDTYGTTLTPLRDDECDQDLSTTVPKLSR